MKVEDYNPSLEKTIAEKRSELDELKNQQTSLDNRQDLEDSLSQIIWEQFILQITGGAANEFFQQNHNYKLSLNRADHYLNSDDFVNGKMPVHNFAHVSEYQTRYKEWESNFTDNTHTNLNKNYRDPFDANRPHGSASMAMDHDISIAEILKDKKAAAFMTADEKIEFANDTSVNLKPLDSAANQSKSDRNMDEWLDSKNKDGLHPGERFNINEKELRQRDKDARDEFEKRKTAAEKRAIQEGNTSARSEIVRSAIVTADAIAVALLAKMLKDVFHEVIVWAINRKEGNNESLIDSVIKGFNYFLKDVKTNALLAADVGLTTILTQMFGEIVITMRKVLLAFQIGWKTCKDICKYLADPANLVKEDYVKATEIEKIAIRGVVTIGGLALSVAITNIIAYYCPPMTVPILPILGSPAGILGIFIGGLTAGIIGVIATNHLDSKIIKHQKDSNAKKQGEVIHEIIELQELQYADVSSNVESTKESSLDQIRQNITDASKEIEEILKTRSEERKTENNDTLDEIDSILKKI